MNTINILITSAVLLSACGPKYGIPEKEADWPLDTKYAFQVVQKGQVSQRGAILNKDVLDLEFNAECKFDQSIQDCRIAGPIKIYQNDANGNRTLQTSQKLDVPIKLKWKGRSLSKVDAANMSELFIDVMQNAFGSLEFPGVPERCEKDYAWKTSTRFQMFKIKGLMGPGSFRNIHKVSDCQDRMHIQSQGVLTMSGQATDNMTAERYSFNAIGTTWVDLQSGIIIERNHRMTLESASVQSQHGDVIRQVIMKRIP